MNQPRHRAQTAFTLVELLVVIGIIALLISMLLPALNKAKEAARTAACLSNIRQSTMGFLLYANDNRNRIPVMRVKGGAIVVWPWFLVAGHDAFDPTGLQIGARYIASNASVLCPSNQYYYKDYVSPNAPTEGLSYGLYMPPYDNQSHLVFTSQFQTTKSLDGLPLFWPASPLSQWIFVTQNLNRIPWPASEAVMLADTISGYPTSMQDGGGHMYSNFDPDWVSNYSTCIHLAHANFRRANVSFYDGHAESRTDKEIRLAANTPHYFYGKNCTVGSQYFLP